MLALATLALPAILLLTPATAAGPRLASVPVQGVPDGDTVIAITNSGTRLSVRPLGIEAQTIAFGTKPGQPVGKVAMKFLWEFIDLTLKVLGIVGVVAILLAAVRLWFHDRAVARRREDLRICPGCYKVVRRRSASRCPYCRAELTPVARVEAPPLRAEPGRYSPVREEPIRKAQRTPPVREEPIREGQLRERAHEEPIREAPVQQEAAHNERVRKEPIREEPIPEGPEEWEREEWEGVEWEREEEEREERVRRRKVFLYTFLATLTVGYVLAAILFLLLRL